MGEVMRRVDIVDNHRANSAVSGTMFILPGIPSLAGNQVLASLVAIQLAVLCLLNGTAGERTQMHTCAAGAIHLLLMLVGMLVAAGLQECSLCM
jgi:hypothetical protein